MVDAIYDHNYFHSNNIEDAKKIILGYYGGLNVDERWKLETEWLIKHIKFNNEQELVVDYGCGIGRIAKEIKNPVIGVDFSQTMRLQAEVYVSRDGFCAVNPEIFKVLIDEGLEISGLVSIWAFQHIYEVEEIIDMLMKAMKIGGIFWLLDLNVRCIHFKFKDSDDVFVYNDEKEILPMIDKWCDLEKVEVVPIYISDVRLELRKYIRK